MPSAAIDRRLPIGPALRHTEYLNLAVTRAPSVMGLPSADQPWPDGTGVRLTPPGCFGPEFRDVVRAAPGLYCAISDRTNRTDQAVKMQSDGWLLLQFRLSGPSDYLFEDHGQERVQNLTAHIVVFPPGMAEAEWFHSSSRVRNVGIAVSPSYISDTLEIPSGALPLPLRAFLDGRQAQFFFQSLMMSPAMVRAAREILECSLRGPLRRAYCEAKAIELQCLTMDSLAESLSASIPPIKLTRRDICRLHELHRYLDLHLEHMPTIAALSRQFGMNRNKLSYGFKYLFGTSIMQCVRGQQMQTALALLRDTDLSVGAIAERIGYWHQTNFTSAFKAQFGCLPLDVRKRRRAPAQ